MRSLFAIIITLGLLLLAGCIAFPKGETHFLDAFEQHQKTSENDQFVIATWNLGYAGLGAEQDFRADGGSRLRTQDKVENEAYAEGIAKTLRQVPADVFLFQEIAYPSYVNRHVDLMSIVRRALPSHKFVFSSEYFIRLPFRFNIHTGIATALSADIDATESIEALPTGKSKINFGREFPVQIFRFRHNNMPFTILNVHFSAFDKDGSTRRQQLDYALKISNQEYLSGRHVILGGDFNLEMSKTTIEHSTDPEIMSWLMDFPDEALPEGWKLLYDHHTPSFRSLDRPYVRGQNYVGNIDGFIISPNLHDLCTRTINEHFLSSDHQLTVLTVSIDSNAESSCRLDIRRDANL